MCRRCQGVRPGTQGILRSRRGKVLNGLCSAARIARSSPAKRKAVLSLADRLFLPQPEIVGKRLALWISLAHTTAITALTAACICDENARCAPAFSGKGAGHLIRRRLETELIQERLAWFAKDARESAALLPFGAIEDELLRKAEQADSAAEFDVWDTSPRLQRKKSTNVRELSSPKLA